VRYAARRNWSWWRALLTSATDVARRRAIGCDNDDPECGSQQYGLARLATNVCNQGRFRRHMLTASFTARDPFETFSPTLLDHQAANAMDARWDSEAEHLECRQSSARSAPFGSIVTITMASMTPLVADLYAKIA